MSPLSAELLHFPLVPPALRVSSLFSRLLLTYKFLLPHCFNMTAPDAQQCMSFSFKNVFLQINTLLLILFNFSTNAFLN